MGPSPKKDVPEEYLPVLMRHAKAHMKEEEKKGIFRRLEKEGARRNHAKK